MKRALLVLLGLIVIALLVCCFVLNCGSEPANPPADLPVQDEAKLAGRDAESFPQAGEDWFFLMDGGIPLSEEGVKGRNTWLVWTGGN